MQAPSVQPGVRKLECARLSVQARVRKLEMQTWVCRTECAGLSVQACRCRFECVRSSAHAFVSACCAESELSQARVGRLEGAGVKCGFESVVSSVQGPLECAGLSPQRLACAGLNAQA